MVPKMGCKMDMRMEFRRQLAHIMLGLSIIYLSLFTRLSPWWFIAFGAVCEITILFNIVIKLPVADWLVRTFERDDCNFPGEGFFSLFLGSALVLLVFDKDIAFAAILVLTFGDSISNLVGGLIGQVHFPEWFNKRKTLEGSFAGWLVAFNLAMFFVTPLEALVAASIGMLAEVIEIRFKWGRVEDNITIPLFAGLGVYALRLFTKGLI